MIFTANSSLCTKLHSFSNAYTSLMLFVCLAKCYYSFLTDEENEYQEG